MIHLISVVDQQIVLNPPHFLVHTNDNDAHVAAARRENGRYPPPPAAVQPTSQIEQPPATTAPAPAAAAMQIFSNRFGPYPFTEMDFINTPTLALGIEYPGIMAITGRVYDPDGTLGSTPNSAIIEGTTAHEVGHQWFYSVVGNDQLDEPWLDESITQYITWLYFRDRYGNEAAEGFFQSFQGRWDRVEQADIPIGLPVSAYEGAEYSGIIYGRGPIFVRELAATMGEDTFDAFLQDYYRTYQWQTANTNDFLALAEAHCNCQLDALFAAQVFAK